MGRNEPCWCRSGKKWKHCHRERGTQERRNVHELLDAVHREQTKGNCAHPDAGAQTCSGRTTNAHTIQKEGGLRAISENGHVVSIKKGAFAIGKNAGQIVPTQEGIASASTFPGFCNAHDAMFNPTELSTVTLGREVAFLLSYRAIVYEKFLKEAALRSIEFDRREADKGRPFVEQALIQTRLYAQECATKLGLGDAARCKAAFDAAYRASPAGFNFLVVEFASVLPVVSCGAFYPDFDLIGQPLQSLPAEDPLDPIAVNLTVLNGRSVFSLGWIGSGGSPEAFAASYRSLPDPEKANAAIRLVFEYLENTHCRPSWWNSLPQVIRDGVGASLFTLNAPPVCRRGANGLCLDGKVLASGSVVDIQWGACSPEPIGSTARNGSAPRSAAARS
jgi:hypothetical protein